MIHRIDLSRPALEMLMGKGEHFPPTGLVLGKDSVSHIFRVLLSRMILDLVLAAQLFHRKSLILDLQNSSNNFRIILKMKVAHLSWVQKWRGQCYTQEVPDLMVSHHLRQHREWRSSELEVHLSNRHWSRQVLRLAGNLSSQRQRRIVSCHLCERKKREYRR